MLLPCPVQAQDDGSRTYQLLPADTHLLTFFAVANQGNQADDPAIVTPGSVIDTQAGRVSLCPIFRLGPDMAASVFAILPTGKVSGTSRRRAGRDQQRHWRRPASAACWA